jgi:hypothetical protein
VVFLVYLVPQFTATNHVTMVIFFLFVALVELVVQVKQNRIKVTSEKGKIFSS